MVWTLLLLLTVAWLLVLLAGIGGPWSWLLPIALGGVLIYRLLRSVGRG